MRQIRKNDQVLLQVFGRNAFVPLVVSFTEKTALALGLGESEALALTLAAEEVFSYLCRVVPPETGCIEVWSSSGGYYVQLDFIFPTTDLDMRAFNITATLSLADDADVEQMGLLLASRSVDRFKIEPEEGRRLRLTLMKERAYPLIKEGPKPPIPVFTEFCVRSPDAGELRLFAELVHAYYRDQLIPDVFHYPGKLTDMVVGGEYQAAVAVSPSGAIGGGTFWHWREAKAVEWFGPYLFDQKPESGIATALLESCIGAIARSSAVMLISHFPTPEFPQEEFEYLGKVQHHKEDGTISYREAWARLLQEDLGCVVWAHPQLHGFLRKEYARLVLPREIRVITNQEERRSPHSVILCTFNRPQGNVTLQSIWSGEDFEENLSQHRDLFRKERILNVYFAMNLGRFWEAEFAPGLLRNGFRPIVILPYAGVGDLLIFQAEEASS